MISLKMTSIQGKRYTASVYAIAAGLYPMLYYYYSNFTLVNSWSQFSMFLLTYILIPIATFNFLIFLSRKILPEKLKNYVLPILNLNLFSVLIVFSIYGFNIKVLLVTALVANSIVMIMTRHFYKIVIMQLLMAFVTFLMLIPEFYNYLSYSDNWSIQQDFINQVNFKEKPNIYVIQPDGYPNFTELSKGYYKYDNSKFENYLEEKGFELYPNFRSNYFSTLSSNSSMFGMKHHFYNNTKSKINELYNARDFIVGENPVVKIFKRNGYKTNLLLEKSYLLLNRPKIGFDYCNVRQSEVSFLAKGFEINKNIIKDLSYIISDNNQPNFYFIENLEPGHISTRKYLSKGQEEERIGYLKDLEASNLWLQEIIEVIEMNDVNPLIIIVADHGGFVGFDYTLECKNKQTDRDLIYSIFSTALAVKWGKQGAPSFDDKLKSNVNLFRVLFTHLSQDLSLLENLQSDSSFAIIEKGAPFGVYEYINKEGTLVFKKYNP